MNNLTQLPYQYIKFEHYVSRINNAPKMKLVFYQFQGWMTINVSLLFLYSYVYYRLHRSMSSNGYSVYYSSVSSLPSLGIPSGLFRVYVVKALQQLVKYKCFHFRLWYSSSIERAYDRGAFTRLFPSANISFNTYFITGKMYEGFLFIFLFLEN